MVRYAAAIGVGGAGLIAALALFGSQLFAVEYKAPGVETEAAMAATATGTVREANTDVSPPVVPDTRTEVQHVPLPKQVKAIYMTSCVVGTPTFRQRLVDLINDTEVNAVVIDVKDFSGTLSFPPESPEWQSAWQQARCGTRDMRTFLATLHELGIFTIARVTVFQDPFYTAAHPELAVKRADGVTVWKDYKGLSFIDVGARPYWDHLVALSKDIYNVGFDEINYDYVRYPSDGPMSDISFTQSAHFPGDDDMQANLETFFKYLNGKLDDETLFAEYNHVNTGRASSTPWTSADLFGMTTTNHDDLSIGQVLERAIPYFDFIAPMVYPSHYPNNFMGLGDPNDHPYQVVNIAMKSGAERVQATTTSLMGFTHTRIGTSTPAVYAKPSYPATKLRTWIQDFDYGGDYDANDVRAQITASYDAGVNDWMIWAPSNNYTRGALFGPGFTELSNGAQALE